MSLKLADRIRETTTSTGTGTITLGGAVSGFRAFSSVLSNTDTTYYVIVSSTAADWEVGVGTYNTNTLSRDTVLDSSNSNALVDFTVGTKAVFIAQPAGRAVYSDGTSIVSADGVPVKTTGGGTGVTSYTAGDTLYYAAGTVLSKLAIGTAGQVMTSSGTAPQWSTLSGIAVTTISFGSTGLTPNTATAGAVSVAGTLITTNGGTGLTSFTAGDLVYFASGTSFTKLGIGTNGQVLTSSGTAPQWTAASSVGVTTISFGSTGLTPSTATNGAVTVAGTLVVANGGTGVTASTGANSVMLRDANQNIAANSFLSNFTTVVSAGTTTTLTVSSAPFYLITGSTSHTFQLPNATTLVNGTTFAFNNNSSSGSVSVNNGAVSPTLIATVGSGSYTVVTLLDNSTQAGSWDKHVQAPSNVTWTTNTFNYVGSITGATWNGTAVGVLYGGTGATTIAGAQTNLQVDPAGTAVAMAIALG